MARILIFIRRNRSLTQDEFRSYYEDHHSVFALRYIRPFLTGYRRNYPQSAFSYLDAVESDGAAPASAFDYDCVTEMSFASDADLDAMFARLAEPDVRAAIAEDEARFIDPTSVLVLRCAEHHSSL